MNLRKLTLSSLLVGIGVVSSHLIYVPVGVSKVFPVQHMINILMAILFGPWQGFAVAFLISLIRNILGSGSLLAFPGSMIGAFLAGILYKSTHKSIHAVIGEVLGTGIIGAMVSYPLATFIMGREIPLLFFVSPFILSSITGAIIGYYLFKIIIKTKALQFYFNNRGGIK